MSKLDLYQDFYKRARLAQRLSTRYKSQAGSADWRNFIVEMQDELEKRDDDEATRIFHSMTPEEQQEAIIWKLAQG